MQDFYGNALNQNRNGANGEASDVFVETIRQTAPGSSDLLSITGIPSSGIAGTSESFTVTAPVQMAAPILATWGLSSLRAQTHKPFFRHQLIPSPPATRA